jgi:hypothetical protein
LNTKHYVIAKTIEDEVKGSINLEKLFAKKCLMCLQVQYNKKIGPKGPFKIDMCEKKAFARLWSFDCEKSFVHAICEKYMVEVIAYAFVSLSSFFPSFYFFSQ